MNAPKWVKSLWSGYPAAGALVVVFGVLAVTSILKKSATSDETVHLAAGYSYWHHNDYRIDPENGNLPQRWMGLPFLVGHHTYPRQEPGMLDEWQVGYDFLFNWGNNPDWLLLQARAMIALLGAGLGLLVYGWSRRLYGRLGGWISLVLYVFSTAMLANSSLGTSDTAASLCFLASAGCLWRVLHRVSPLTVAGSCLVMGALFVSKMSAALIIPIGVVLILIRLASARPLVVAAGRTVQIAKPSRQALVFLGLILLHVLATWAIIWAFYGFRYSVVSASPVQQSETARRYWQNYQGGTFPFRSEIEFLAKHHLLPEGFLLGQAHVLKFSQSRPSFLNGQYSITGWRSFFPYCFLAKTSLGVFVVLILAGAGAYLSWRRRKGKRPPAGEQTVRQSLYRTAPLWVLLAVYWAFAISSKMNIGHRHILPTYPPMFVLAGAAACWFARPGRVAKIALVAALVFVAGEALWMWPNYLAYFNPLASGPRNGYRHLVDSSLDWGQDVPGLKAWLDRNGLSNQNRTVVYLSYFGNGSPTYYGVQAERLPGYVNRDLFKGGRLHVSRVGPLTAGVYCISATILQSVLLEPFGPWSRVYEETYRSLLADMERIGTLPPDQQAAIVADPMVQDKAGLFGELQLARLCAYLRKRQPDDHIGYSILIYRLTQRQVQEATDPNLGLPAEMTPDRIPLRARLTMERDMDR